MPTLNEHPMLTDFQTYVAKLETERGFADQSVRDKCLLLGEEIGELFKSVRKTEGLKTQKNTCRLRTIVFTHIMSLMVLVRLLSA